MNQHEEVVAVEAMQPSNEIDPTKSANTQAMMASVIDIASSSEGMEEAKKALDSSISKMMAYDDPFMQMMVAIYEVLPGTLLYKEEKLLYDTDAFKFVTQLNNHMTKMMNYYSKSADYQAQSDVGGPNESGLSTGGSGEDVWGLAAGDAYIKEMEDLKALVLSSDLPADIKAAMDSAFAKIGVANSSSLWNGLAGPYRATGIEIKRCVQQDGHGQWKQVEVNHPHHGPGNHKWDWVDSYTGEQGCFTRKRNCYVWEGGGSCFWTGDSKVSGTCYGHMGEGGQYGTYIKTVGDSDMVVGYDGNLVDLGYSHSSRRVMAYQPTVDSSTTGNLELQTVVNSYSATVEVQFMFDMEQYNTYANTNAQTMQAHINQVAAPVTRLTHISHA